MSGATHLRGSASEWQPNTSYGRTDTWRSGARALRLKRSTSTLRRGTSCRRQRPAASVRSSCGFGVLVEPSYGVSRSSLTYQAPTLNRPPSVTPSVNTPRQPGRYGFAQPLQVIAAGWRFEAPARVVDERGERSG